MPRSGPSHILLFAGVLLGCLGGIPGTSSELCAEPPRDTTALLLQRGGPEVIIIEYNVTTGRPTGLRKVIKRQWSALSGFAIDSQAQRAHFFTTAPQVALYSFALSVSSLLELQSTEGDGLRLRDAANASVPNVWNVAPWESRSSLLAVAPSAAGVFNTSVLAVNTSSGLVEVLGEVRGSPVQGMYALDSKGGRYFFVVTQIHRRVLVVYHVEEGVYELVGLGRDVEDLAGMHYDREGCRLVVIFARPNGVLEVLAVGLPGQGQEGDATLTHLATMASASGKTYESYHYVGLTALLSVGTKLSILSREPNKLNLAIHHLEQKSHTAIHIDSSDIVGMAIRTRRKPTVTSLEPGHVGIWGQSRGTVIGFDFGVRDPSPRVVVGNTMASSVAWISDSAISFKAPALPARISDPWLQADGFVYRTSWGEFAGEIDLHQRGEEIACHPRYAVDTVCAYAGTAREMRCTELSVGFVCARYDLGWDETVSLDVQLGIYGSWLTSDVSADVVATWFSVEPTEAPVDGGEMLTITGGPFAEDKGTFRCSFGGQIQGAATYFNQSIVTCQVPRWPLMPDVTKVELLQAGSGILSDWSGNLLFVPGVPAQLVLLAAPAQAVAQEQSQVFELQLRDQDGNHVVEHLSNITVQLVALVLAQANAGALPNLIEGASKQETVAGRASFVFSIQRAGTYHIRFTTESCQSSANSGSDGCLAVNGTLEVLLAVPIKSITISAPRHALAGLPVFPEPEIRVLDSESRVSDVGVQVVADLAGSHSSAAFSASNALTSGGIVRFTDLTILPNGTHTIVFTLTGAYSHIQIQHNITVLYSAPRHLFNGGSRPFGIHPSMLPLSPAPSIWVLDVAGNRIQSRYWTQMGNGTLVPHYLNILIHAEVSRDALVMPSAAIPSEPSEPSLFGAVDVLLQGQAGIAGQCLKGACSGHGSCNMTVTQVSPACTCQLGWQGAVCWLPSQSHLCGAGDVCASDLGYWDGDARTCACLNSSSMQYELTQSEGQSADFSELFMDRAGKGYSISFTADGLTAAHSFLFAIAAGVGSRLHVVSHPAWAAAGAGLSNSPVVLLKDAGQNLVTASYVAGALNITVRLVDAATQPSLDAAKQATLTGTLVRKLYEGRVVFTNLIIDRPSLASAYRLKFSSSSLEGLLPAYTHPFAVEEGPPALLTIVQQPDAASGGTPFRLQPKLAILDPAANVVSRAQGSVVARLQAPHLQGLHMLLGNTHVRLIDGEAQFTDLAINLNASGYEMVFTASVQSVKMPPGINGHRWYAEANLSQVSLPFQVMAGRVVSMVIFRQPGQAYGGEMVPQPILRFLDSGGNVVAGDRMMINVAVINVAARQPQAPDVHLGYSDVHLGYYASDTGSMQFTDLQLLHAGQRFQLVFSINETASERWAGRQASIVSAAFDNTHGALSNLSITVQPDNKPGGWYFSRSISIVLMDRSGNLVPKTGVKISVSIDMSSVALTYAPFNSSLSPDGSRELVCGRDELPALQGTSQVSTTQGVAFFTDLRVGKAGFGFRLVFESNLLASARSEPFGVSLGEIAVSLHVVCNPGIEVAGVAFAQQPILDVVDRGGNRMHAQMPASIVAKLIPQTWPAAMTGVLNASMHGDLATFTNLAVDLADDGYVIEFYAEGLASARSFAFQVIAGEAVLLHAQGRMSQPFPAEAFQMSITSRDRGGNVNSSSSSLHFNVTAHLLRVESLTRLVTCRGAHECLSSIDLSVPQGSHLLSANVSIRTACTDFDSALEQVRSVMMGSYSLKPASQYQPGPFAGCFRDCSKSAQVTAQYDIVHPICLDGGRSDQKVCKRLPLLMQFDREESTKWDLMQALNQFDISATALRVQTSAEVNFNACNGYLLDGRVDVLLTYTVPEHQSVLIGNPKALSQNGVATFTDLVIDVMQRDFVLGFTSDSNHLLPAYSELFRLNHGPVRQLIMLSQPGYGTGNRTLQPAPFLMLADAANNRVDGTGVMVVAHLIVRDGIRPLASQLKGHTQVASKQGLVHFTDLFVGLKSDAFNYTILFSVVRDNVVAPTAACNASLSICSAPFPVYEGPACCMRLAVRPHTATAAVPFSAQPLLKAFDWGGNGIALSKAEVSVKIGVNGGITGRVLGAMAVFTNGSALFTDLAIDKTGFNYTLVFMSPKMISIKSLAFSIGVGTASTLVVVRQVGGARVDKLFRIQPSVAVADDGGNVVKSWVGHVLVTIYQQGIAIHAAIPTNGNATLTGTTTGYIYKGVSYFWNLRLDRMGANFQLGFSAGGLTDGVSKAFDVFGSNATRLVILSSPPVYTTILPNPEIVVAALDDLGNVDGFSDRRFGLAMLEGVNLAPQLIHAPELVFSKGILSISGMQLMGAAVQARWQITETTLARMSITSDPFDMIDALTGWWTLSARNSTSKIFVQRDLNTLQVRAHVQHSKHTPFAIRQPNLYSKYGSLRSEKDGCIETSLISDVSSIVSGVQQSNANLLGYQFRSCQLGVLQGTVASKVGMTSAVDASWARDIVYIEIQEYEPVKQLQKFIVIANSKNSSSNTSDSVVYRWNGQGLELYQRLAGTKGAHDIEHFVFGGLHYILVANHFDDTGAGFGVASMLYQYTWSRTQVRNIFKPIQAISTEGAVSWKYVEIEHQHFLVSANYFNGSHTAINSSVYRLQRHDPDSTVPRLSAIQSIPTNGATDVVYIWDQTKHMIVFANRFETSLQVMEWSHASQRFLAAGHLPCAQAVDLEVFSANSMSYVVCMSLTNIEFHSGSIPTNGSAVFRFDSSTNDFVRVQQLPTQTGKYMSVFTSGDEILLAVANVELIGANAVPVHLQDRHSGTTEIFSWDGTQFIPYLNLPTRQGYANVILDVPCSGLSVDGSACADRTFERLVLVAQGEDIGIQTIIMDGVHARREATHLKMLPVIPTSTTVNSTVVPALIGRVMNLGVPSSVSWIQETVVADSLKWTHPVAGTLNVPASAVAYGVNQVVVNASGFVAFSNVVVVAAGIVSMRVSNMYLNAVRMANTASFHVTAGAAAKLVILSAAPLALVSGDTLSAIVIVSDAFGNHQAILSSPLTITAFSSGTSGLTLVNHSVTTDDGIARFRLSVSGNSMDGVIEFRAASLETAYTSPLSVKTVSAVFPIESSQVLIGAAVVAIGNNQLVFFGGLNGSVASKTFVMADVSSLPYQFSQPSFSGTLPAARYDHEAVGGVFVNSQSVVLVIGGTDGSTTFNDVHAYHLVTRRWTNLNLLIDSSGRSGHRAQLASFTFGASRAPSTKSVVAVLGGRDSSGAAAGGISILGLVSTSIRVEEVTVDNGNPFTEHALGCCAFMFKWHGGEGYVFGKDSSGVGRLYVLTIAFQIPQNQFEVTWLRKYPDTSDALILPRSALSKSAFELGGQLFFPASRSTSTEDAGVYALDVSAATLKWLQVDVGAFYLEKDSMYAMTNVAMGKAFLVPTKPRVLGPWSRRRMLAVNDMALVLSVVTAERLVAVRYVPIGALSGVILSPQPVVSMENSEGKRARDQSGYADVTVTAYDGDTLLPIGLRGQQVVESIDGIASFLDLDIINSAKRVMLRFTSPSLFPTTWGPFEVVTGPGAYALLALEPYGAQPGKVFSIQPSVKLTDAAGNDVTSDSTTMVSVGLQTQIATHSFEDAAHLLTGTTLAVVSGGVFAFTDLGMAQNTPHYINFRLAIMASGMTSSVSTQFHLTRPSETRLHLNWTMQTDVCPQTSVADDDACIVYRGQAASSKVLIAGMPTRRPPQLTTTLNNTLTKFSHEAACSGGCSSPCGDSCVMVHGSNFAAFTKCLDECGLIQSKALFNLTLVWAVNGSGVVGGMTTLHAEAVAGEAYFLGFQVNVVGQGYRLKVSGVGYPEVLSETFDVVPAVPYAMHVISDVSQSVQVVYPSTVAFSTQPIVYVVDVQGNAVDVATSVSASVSASVHPNGLSASVHLNAGLIGNSVALASGGMATFTDLGLEKKGKYWLGFTACDMCCGTQLNTTSSPFDIGVGPPKQLEEAIAPGGGAGSEAFVQQPVIHILDSGGNRVLTDSSTVVTAELEKDRALRAIALKKILAVGKTVSSMQHFAANGTDYILVAINYDAQIESYHLESLLYRWDGSQDVMVQVQRIVTEGATSCAHLEYKNQHYVFITNGYKEVEIIGNEIIGTYLTESELHRLSGGVLEKIETFGTQSPSNIATFMADGQMYVVVANSYDGTNSLVQSDVYIFSPWNPTKLSLVQEILLDSVKVFHSLYYRGEVYVFAGSNFNRTSFAYVCDSQFYRFQNGFLEAWQRVRTYGIVAVESFEVGAGHTFIAIGNSVNKHDTSDQGFIAIHAFKNGRLLDIAEQEIGPIAAMTDMQHFSVNGTEYLAVTSNPRDSDGYLMVYSWDASNCSTTCTPYLVLDEKTKIDDAESLVYFRTPDASFMVYGGASGFQGIAFRSRTSVVGTSSAKALNGVASFTDLGINLVQTNYRLRYEAQGMVPFSGASFAVAFGRPVELLLLSHGGNALGGQAFAMQPRVALVDKGGNIVLTQEGQEVSVMLVDWQTVPVAPRLRGNVQAPVAQGVATFTDLGIDRVGWSVLQFNCSSYTYPLKSATQLITVKTGVAHGVVVLQSGALALGGMAFSTQPILALVDAGGNTMLDAPGNAHTNKQAHASASGTSGASVASAAAIRVGVSISSESGTKLSAFALGSVAATMVSSPSSDVGYATLQGEMQLVMAVSEVEVGVYEWGCQGPSVMQTIAASHVTHFEMLRVGGVVWMFVAATQPGALKIFARSVLQEVFVLKYEVPLQGLSSLQGVLLGGKPFVLATGTIRNEDTFLQSNYTTLYALGVNNESSVTAFDVVQKMDVGQLLDFETFKYEYKDYLLLQNASHLTLNVWNSITGIFEEMESIPFVAEQVKVACCTDSGLPVIGLARLASPSVFAVLHSQEYKQMSLVSIQNAASNQLPLAVSADQVSYIWRGSMLYACLTSASHVWVFRSPLSTLGILPFETLFLPATYKALATRLHQALTFFEAAGGTYLLLTGRDEECVLLQIDGPGSLSGSTVLLAADGLVEFTDLALDLVGPYTLSFSALSLHGEHKSVADSCCCGCDHEYVGGGVVMNISVGLGEARSLALASTPLAGKMPTVDVVDGGGNRLDTRLVDTLHLAVVALRDVPAVYTDLSLVSSHQFGYPAHVHHFAVNGSHYIAIADSYDGQRYKTVSQIMKLVEAVSGDYLQGVATLMTKCAYRFSSFEITSYNVTRTPVTVTDYYIAVANHFDDNPADLTYATHSIIYKMNPTSETFWAVQQIPTVGATKLEPFSMHGVQYIAIANFFDGSFHGVDSQIWKWDAIMGNFSWMHNIATEGAHDIEHISSGADHFLLVAQYRSSNQVNFASSSLVLQYRQTSGTFELLTTLATAAARDIEPFIINGVNYFAVANYINLDDGSKETRSVLYTLECNVASASAAGAGSATRYAVAVHQTFASTGGSSWTHFERGGRHYLALTNLDGSEKDSMMIFSWNGTAFDFYNNATTDGQAVIAADFFTGAGGYYSVMALAQDSSVNLYKFVSSDGAVPGKVGPLSPIAGQLALSSLSYTPGELYDFRTDPEGHLHPVASGPVS